MKPILLAGAIILGANALAYPAIAADVPWSWTGFYAGGNVGYGWGNIPSAYTVTSNVTTTVNIIQVDETATAGAPAGSTTTAGSALGQMNGWLGGVQGGYNWQTGWWVFGFETDFQWTGQTGGSTLCSGCPAGSLFASNSTSLPWFGTVRGRIGATSEPTPWGPIFFYITGGLAYGQVDASYTEGIVGGLTNTVSANSTRLGWTFGGGGEARIGTSNWTVKGEVLYIDFGNISGATGATLGPVTTPININGTIGTITTTTTIIGTASTHVTDAIFRVGFNYRFPP